MKIFFLGQNRGSNGPSNVNKALIKNFSSEFSYIKCKNKIARSFEMAFKIVSSDVTVISGLSMNGYHVACLAKKFNKKVIYIMHGCSAYESKLNGETNAAAEQTENNILNKSDLILAVSEKFSKWLKKEYPEFAGKINFLNNGLEKPDYGNLNFEKIPGSIIATGGDRNSKNNAVLCKVIERMDGETFLFVYGHIHNRKPEATKYTRYMGAVPHSELYRQMAKSEIFVLNSLFEPFNLSVIDALNCKCSVLVSNNAGVADLLNLNDEDIIYDPNDTDEIEEKIKYLLKHPNYERIFHDLDYESNSYANAVNKLKAFASEP